MTFEKFKEQKETRRRNDESIMIELNESPKRFKDLTDKLKLSPMGLTKVLNRLVQEKKIQKVLYEGHEAYELTKEGQRELEQLWYIYHELDYLRENKASYVHSLTFPFMSMDVIMLYKEDKNKSSDRDHFSLIPNIPEFQDFIIEQIFKNVKESNLKVESSDSKFLISFEFDFNSLSKFFNQIKIFIDDIKANRDVLTDDKLGDIGVGTKNRLFILSVLISNSNYFTTVDKEFNENLIKYLQSFDNKEKTENLFGLNYKILNQLTEDIKKGIDPLKDKKISNDLIIKDGNVTHFLIKDYLQLAMFINFGNKPIYNLIEKYQNSLVNWFENGEFTLRSKEEINEVKQ